MFCRECGNQCKDTAKFCVKCGAKLSEKRPDKETTSNVKPKKPANKKTAVKKPAASKRKQKTVAVKKTAKVKPQKKESTYNEKKMKIYEMTPQDNCGECGCKNCMQFAMQAASPKNSMELDDCRYIDEDEAEEFYSLYK